MDDIFKLQKLYRFVHHLTISEFEAKVNSGIIRIGDLYECKEMAIMQDVTAVFSGESVLYAWLHSEDLEKQRRQADETQFAEACAIAQENVGNLEAAKKIREAVKNLR